MVQPRSETLVRIDRVLGMWSAGVGLDEICLREGCSIGTVMGYLRYGRLSGDLRAVPRRLSKSSQTVLFEQALLAAGGVVVSVEDLRDLLWPTDDRRPSSWRTILSLCANRLRVKGLNVKYEDGGYRVLGGVVRGVGV